MPLLLGVALGGALGGALCAQQQEPEPSRWFETPSLHEAQADVADGVLETPQATLERFFDAAHDRRWQDAAQTLDLRLVDVDVAGAAELAEKFAYVLHQEIWVDWDTVPDRADGLLEPGLLGGSDPMAGRARRGIRIGAIDLGDRRVPILLHRMKAPDRAPVWLFGAHTVENIEALHEAHGPSSVSRWMPGWARERGMLRVPIWQWIGLAIALLVAPAMGYVVGSKIVGSLAKRAPDGVRRMSHRLRAPICTLIAAITAWAMIDGALGLPSFLASFLDPATLIVMVAAFVWVLMRVISLLVDHVLERSVRAGSQEDDSQRRLLTQITVARHVILFALAMVGVAIVLLQLNSFRAVGVTLLSSAGAMAVIVGVAGHTVIGNLVAGLHIALAQPFRIGDVVEVEGHWGHIEDVSYVDVVVRTWDERRLIFPIRYFVDHWFENWSKKDEFVLQTIRLQVDYAADVARIRERFEELVRDDEDYDDRKEPEVLVTDLGDEVMTLRMSAGGADPSAAWRMVNRVREHLITWLQAVEGGSWLPRRRLQLSRGDARGDGEPRPSSS